MDKYQENRELMDPSLGGIKTLGNTLSMYHQPAQNWQVRVASRPRPGCGGCGMPFPRHRTCWLTRSILVCALAVQVVG